MELQAAKERAEAEAKARIEAQARAKAEAEAKALRDAEAKRLADEKASAEAKAKADAAAAKKAAAAPDKAKLQEFAEKVRSLVVPLASSEAGREIAAEINRKVESFAKWIESQSATL
jgi:membrane protein involved in colicin uptake